MSMEEAVRFLRSWCDENTTGDIDVNDLIDRAAAEGFEVTQEDLRAAAEQVVDYLQDTGELGEDQLDSVSGGGESIRNERQLCSSQFENANQKATQYVNMLSQVLKTMNEMKAGVIRNLR